MSKHILIVSQCFYPEQFRINDIATEWVNRGYRVTVLTGIPNYPQRKFYEGYGLFKKRKETWNGIDIIRIPLIACGSNSIGLVLNYISFVVSGFFWKCFTKVKADLVFNFETSPMTQALIGVWYAKKNKIPNYLYVQDLWPETVEVVTGIHNKTIIGAIGKMVDYIYKNCDKIFGTSPAFVKAIQRRTPNSESKVSYLPQYAEEFYRPSDIISDLIPQDGVMNITFTGNIGTAQGLEILPKTAKILQEQKIKVRFNIVGDGRNKVNFVNTIKEMQVEDYFNLVGQHPAEVIPSVLAASDAAFLSFSDALLYAMTIPAKLQSYMACGCPIIASAIGETKRVIEEAECGIVSDVGSPDELAESIVHFSHLTSEERKRMSDNAVRYSDINYSRESIIEQMLNDIAR